MPEQLLQRDLAALSRVAALPERYLRAQTRIFERPIGNYRVGELDILIELFPSDSDRMNRHLMAADFLDGLEIDAACCGPITSPAPFWQRFYRTLLEPNPGPVGGTRPFYLATANARSGLGEASTV